MEGSTNSGDPANDPPHYLLSRTTNRPEVQAWSAALKNQMPRWNPAIELQLDKQQIQISKEINIL